MHTRRLVVLALAGVFAGLFAGCTDLAGSDPIPTQVPADYLGSALDWMAAHAVRSSAVDWPAVRREATALAPAPQSAADTYPAIKFALQQLGDYGFILGPDDLTGQTGAGVGVLFPDGLIFSVDAGSKAEAAGIRPGDIVEQVNGKPLVPFNGWRPKSLLSWGAALGKGPTYTLSVRRAGQGQPVDITVPAMQISQTGSPSVRRLPSPGGDLGYIELAFDSGTSRYPTIVQQGMRDADSSAVCGWIVDLRRNTGGDIWSMLAAVGPILGDGQVGGFAYPDGKRDTWAYRDGKVFWNADERDEDFVDGGVYHPKRAMPPVALLLSRVTQAAGELVAVAFHGRPATRTFGEATSGAPVLINHTALSDGAELIVSAAYGLDRHGAIYDGPISPDQSVTIDWPHLGTDTDSAISAAAEWLRAQPGCAH